MIYVDTPFRVHEDAYPNAPRVFKGKLSAHLMADSDDELIAYAVKIGMKRQWIQRPGTLRAHFDVTGQFLQRVMADTLVQKLTPRDMAQWYIQKASLA